jgi:hypothetical protein
MKVRHLHACELDLAGGVKVVLVQHGADWNGLREFRCVSPASFAGQLVIATPANRLDEGAFARHFRLALNFDHVEEWSVVMASPDIGVAIRGSERADPSAGGGV